MESEEIDQELFFISDNENGVPPEPAYKKIPQWYRDLGRHFTTMILRIWTQLMTVVLMDQTYPQNSVCLSWMQ